MGTRGLNVIISENEVKVALYNQFDSYPGGQGANVLKFLQALKNREEFVKKVNKCSWIESDELKQLWVSAGADPESDFVSNAVSERFKELYPWLHRDCGADIYWHINSEENGLKTNNSLQFAADSLFCEWAYVVDFDNGFFEVYKGFNKSPLDKNERFSFLQKKPCEYYPVSLVKRYSLDDLPSKADFISYFDKDEYED